MSGAELAAAAETLVGCRFRLHGRDPATGLDCIGVFAATLALTGRSAAIPSGYRLRTAHFEPLATLADQLGFAPASGPAQAGDVMFTRPGPGQLHLIIAGSDSDRFIEANAGLGRVVSTVGPVSDPILYHWRLRSST